MTRYRSNDPAALSHIERRVYVAPCTSPGDSVRYGDWQDRADATWYHNSYCSSSCPQMRHKSELIPLTLIEAATGSDYSGSLVEISNMRCLQKEFPWLVEVYGGHGTRGLAYLGAREHQNPALLEAIDALTEYPVYDDSDHSDLEMEKVSEAWHCDGRDDFKRALVKYFDAMYAPDEHDTDLMPDDVIDQLWYDTVDRMRGGEGYLNEQGDQIYFPIDCVIKDYEHCGPGMSKPSYDGTRPSLDVQLLSLAEIATINTDTE